MNNPPKIVLTGGPSAGKTTLIQVLQKEFHNLIATVPESASILYRGGFHRSDIPEARTHIQKAIYYVQVESENIVSALNPKKIIVCDRGSLDGLAYWPEKSEVSFFDALKTSEAGELSKYDWVIHLDSACKTGYDSSNPIRIESPAEALSINQSILRVWKNHPKRVVIPAEKDFMTKMRMARFLINQVISSLKN